METKQFGAVEFLDKYKMACYDEYVVACLYEGVLEWLDKNNKDDFDVDFIHEQNFE